MEKEYLSSIKLSFKLLDSEENFWGLLRFTLMKFLHPQS